MKLDLFDLLKDEVFVIGGYHVQRQVIRID